MDPSDLSPNVLQIVSVEINGSFPMFLCLVEAKISTRLRVSSTSMASQAQVEENIKP